MLFLRRKVDFVYQEARSLIKDRKRREKRGTPPPYPLPQFHSNLSDERAVREAAKSSSLNGRAIKALPTSPPPSG